MNIIAWVYLILLAVDVVLSPFLVKKKGEGFMTLDILTKLPLMYFLARYLELIN